MKEKTAWKQKNGSKTLKSSGAEKGQKAGGEGKLAKAVLTIVAGIVVAALAMGVKDSSYYD